MKTICICEKPSVARSIARVLGVTEKQEGYLSGNGYAVTCSFSSPSAMVNSSAKLMISSDFSTSK